jgi:hypothetical protein
VFRKESPARPIILLLPVVRNTLFPIELNLGIACAVGGVIARGIWVGCSIQA